ncbi:hypothetical protein AB1Y20_006337 [Prymnesium parvum]|uniref:Uncharacterized protein n=1 Tax=Prymnesium parvum TaxID=97485 RepID=A0AB34J1L3_PRYPA
MWASAVIGSWLVPATASSIAICVIPSLSVRSHTPAFKGEASGVAVGFCDGSGNGFFDTQPDDQLERWELPVDNGSHLHVHWRPARQACGMNVSEYVVSFSSSMPLLDTAANFFGGFPQDVCAAESKARRSVAIDGEADLQSACSPYPRACSTPRTSVVPIPRALRALARFDIEVSIRAWGALRPAGRAAGPSRKVTFWCHKYRRAGRAPAREHTRRRWRWLQWLERAWPRRRALPTARVDSRPSSLPDEETSRTQVVGGTLIVGAVAAVYLLSRSRSPWMRE